MFRFLMDSEPDDGPLLLINPQTGERIVGENPRDLVAALLKKFDYLDIQDGGVSAFMRKTFGDDLLDMDLTPNPFPIDYTSDRKFLEGLALNQFIGIYENDGSYRVRPETPNLPSIEHQCSHCQFNKGDEKCSQFEAWADDDGENCVGFARPDLPPSQLDGEQPMLVLVDFGRPEVFYGGQDAEVEREAALERLFSGQPDEDAE